MANSNSAYPGAAYIRDTENVITTTTSTLACISISPLRPDILCHAVEENVIGDPTGVEVNSFGILAPVAEGPAGPVAPSVPVAPAGPVSPLAPAGPTEPVFPLGPVIDGPAGPVGPIEPVTPRCPLAPAVPGKDVDTGCKRTIFLSSH